MIKKRKIILKITLLTIILILMESTSYARYTKTEILKGKQKIVKPILNMKEGIPIKIDNANRTKSYEFSVENFNENDISEIGFLYTIQIVSNIDLESNFNLKLYKEDEEIQLSNLKTNPIFIKGNERIEQKYKINIEYKEIKKENNELDETIKADSDFENKLDDLTDEISGKIQIKIHAEQERI